MSFQMTSGSKTWEGIQEHTKIRGMDVFLSPIEKMKPESFIDILFFDPPAVDPTWSLNTYKNWFQFEVMTILDAFAKKDAVLILTPRDRKGGVWLKSLATASIIQEDNWNLFRQVMWRRQEADYNRSRYAFGNIFFFRRGNRPVNDSSPIRYKDIIYIKDSPKEGMIGELPVELVEVCLSLFMKPNDVVMDPFAGTGAVAVGALKLGLRSLSVEIDKDNYHYIIKRLGGLTI